MGASDPRVHQMLVSGGSGLVDGALDSSELYDAIADRWVPLEVRLPKRMRCASASLGAASVLVVEIGDRLGTVSTCCPLIDVRSRSLPRLTPNPPFARVYPAISTVEEHTVVLMGGEDTNSAALRDEAQLYDARADRWTERAEWRMPVYSRAHCMVKL